MRFSIVLSTQPASFNAVAYKGHIKDNLRKIKNLGYDGVELAVRDPKLLDLNELMGLLEQVNLPVPALGTGQAYGEEGLSFTNADLDIRTRAIDRIKTHIGLARKLNAVVIIGLIRGKSQPGISYSQSEEWLVEAIRECASTDAYVKLAIEPINRYETDLINTVISGLNLLDKIAKDNVGLLLDTFHMNIEEPSILESIESAKDRMFHFHVADSNRWYPGAGHIDFQEVYNLLHKINYQGFISAEILPLPDADTAAIKAIETLHSIA
ncbi:sugar phosphate isomerase/epimerase [candidate division KSB1 bacterium]|nr:sugar phosphate isomerase/epimerase [candidate division KSB1 bacterium]